SISIRQIRVPFSDSVLRHFPYYTPADNCRYRSAFQFPSAERRVAALRLKLRGLDLYLPVRVEDCHVGHRADLQCPAIEIEYPRGIDREQLHHPPERDHAAINQTVEGQTHGGLQTDHAVRSMVELEHLFVSVMRRVIGGDCVNRPVAQTFYDRLEVG